MKIPRWLKRLLKKINLGEAIAVIENLKKDNLVSSRVRGDFCGDLKAEIKKKGSKKSPKEIFNRFCNRYSLEGPPANIPPEVQTLNHVICESVFSTYLARERISTTPSGSAAAVKEFVSQPLPDQKKRLKDLNVYLGNPDLSYVWAFFPEPESNPGDADPIDDSRVKGSAKRIREMLGLQCSVPEGANLLCFRYPVTVPGKKRVPISISAGFNPCFKFAGDARYGWTYDSGNKTKGFPEILHENLLAEHVSFPVRLVSSAC